MASKSFATVINCMDGRVQLPVIKYMKKKHKVDFVDMITEAGPNKILSSNKNISKVKSIKERVRISVKAHKSKIIAVAGHWNCAGNNVPKETKLKQISLSVKKIQSWNFNLPVIGLWLNKYFKIEEV